MSASRTLPLFPLPLVVFPGESIALHIFEPRYREMLAHCLAHPRSDGDFVIVYSDGEETDSIATTVTIIRVLDQNPDGTANILVRGCRRVSIRMRFQLHSYDSALIEDIEEGSDTVDEALANRVYGLHHQLLTIATGDEPPNSYYERDVPLSFIVAASAGIDAVGQRYFLSLPDETARLRFLEEHIQPLLNLLQTAVPLWKNIVASFALAQLPEQV